jgi:hypothetical protein
MTMEARSSELGRLQEIIRVFTIVGFGDLFKQMGLEERGRGFPQTQARSPR